LGKATSILFRPEPYLPWVIGVFFSLLRGALCSPALGAEPALPSGQQASATALCSGKAILEVVPGLSALGAGWTTNVVAYLLDPCSRPSEIDYRGNVGASLELGVQREIMKTNDRTGCGLVFYGRGDLVMNSGLYRVYIQRWINRRSLHNSWVGWKMNPNRIIRDGPGVGEDSFWVNEWWRQTLVRQNFAFCRGVFHVVIEAGADSRAERLIELALAFDARIRAHAKPETRVPKDAPESEY
jgi:hypothetical protein